MTTNANRVIVETREQFWKLIEHPGSLSGSFDPNKQRGVVLFATQRAAQDARREIERGGL